MRKASVGSHERYVKPPNRLPPPIPTLASHPYPMTLRGALEAFLTSPWLIGGTVLAALALVAPFLLRPRSRPRPHADASNLTSAGRDRPGAALADLEDDIERVDRRIQSLEDERQRILERIADCRRRGDETGEEIHERDHLEAVRLKRRAQESLRFLKDRYHRIRAALHALEDEQMKVEAMDLQHRTHPGDRLDNGAADVDELHDADAELDAYLMSRPGYDELVDDPPKGEVEENRRLIESGLDEIQEDS